MMSDRASGVGDRVRIVTAIAVKDISDALRNKTILTMVVGLAVMILSTQALPLLLKLNPEPRVALLAPTGSKLVEQMAQRDGFSLRHVSTQRELEQWISESSDVILGISLPPDFDEAGSETKTLELDGYWVYWADSASLAQTVAFFEAQLELAAGRDVIIQTNGHVVYPDLNSRGRPFLLSVGFVVGVILVGVMFVPYLMIEEKESQTIHTLLVSPAGYSEVIVGKALAGTCYCLTAAAMFFAFNRVMISQWWVAILAAICGSLFAVAIGLLLGILFDNVASMNLWLGVVVTLLLLPMLIGDSMAARLPGIVRAMVFWVPSAALARLFKASFSNHVPAGIISLNLGVILLAALLVLALAVWRTRRLTQ